VTLMAMTSAYSTFADQGQLRAPILIRRVEDAEGNVLFEAKPAAVQVLAPQTAFLMTSMLSDVVNHGTAYRARQEGFTLPAAGKTGTTNDYVDAWFVGYTPNLATGVWIGFDKPRTIVSNGFAGELAVPLWARFMKVATASHKPDTFKAPQGIVAVNVCRLSGKLPGEACDRIITDYVVRGAAPTQVCQDHYVLAARVFPAGTPGGVEVVAASNGLQAQIQSREAPLALIAQTPPELVVVPEAADAAETPQKKRGFWGRLFGRGEDDKTDQAEDVKP
jgi:penicillin-binding protein 1A